MRLILLACICGLCSGLAAANDPKPAAKQDSWRVELRQRKPIAGSSEARVESRTVLWDPAKTAIIVVDMWDDHHCRSAAQRVNEMAPHMNAVLKAAREKGVRIIHSPSDCMDEYKGTPARERAEKAPKTSASAPFQWNHFNPKREGALADRLEQGGCSCDTPEPCSPGKRVWKKEHPGLEILPGDAVSDKGQEVYNLLQADGIEHIIIMGVHTNRCVLGRPFGIRQLVYLGKDVVLCRDLTDSYHRDPGHHFEGLRAIIAHIERHWCPTITSASITGKSPFHFQADRQAEAR